MGGVTIMKGFGKIEQVILGVNEKICKVINWDCFVGCSS